MERWIGKIAVVTGASSGIGEAIAVRLVEEGLQVVGLARRKERLETLSKTLVDKKGKFYAFPTDMTKEEDILRAFSWIKQNIGLIHILVNSAGVYKLVNFLNLKTEDARAIFDLNVLGLSIACREAVKVFKENGVNGHIININGLLGHSVRGDDTVAMVAAAKHALTALTESLHLEMRRLKMGTKITSISPGLTGTEILDNIPKYANWRESPVILKSKDIADATIYVLSTPPNCQAPEFGFKCLLGVGCESFMIWEGMEIEQASEEDLLIYPNSGAIYSEGEHK